MEHLKKTAYSYHLYLSYISRRTVLTLAVTELETQTHPLCRDVRVYGRPHAYIIHGLLVYNTTHSDRSGSQPTQLGEQPLMAQASTDKKPNAAGRAKQTERRQRSQTMFPPPEPLKTTGSLSYNWANGDKFGTRSKRWLILRMRQTRIESLPS